MSSKPEKWGFRTPEELIKFYKENPKYSPSIAAERWIEGTLSRPCEVFLVSSYDYSTGQMTLKHFKGFKNYQWYYPSYENIMTDLYANY